MKCDYVNLFLYDYVDGYLPSAQRNLIHNHLLSCQQCANTVLEQQELTRSLQSLAMPELPEEFNEHALTHAVNFHENTQKTKYFSITNMAIAASVFFAATTGFLLTQQPTQTPLVEMVAENKNEVHGEHLNLVFNSPKALSNVTFTVILPENVEMMGHPGKKRVVWSSQLQAGQNLLSLPIIAKEKSTGTLITIIDYENNSKMFEVKLKNKKLLT